MARAQPNRPAGWIGLAQCAAAEEDWEAALAAWTTCIALAQDPAPQAWQLGALRAMAALGDVPAARRAAAQIVAAYPGCDAARNILLRLLAQSADRAALAEESTTGTLRDGRDFANGVAYFRAQMMLENHAACRAIFGRLVAQAERPAQINMLFERTANCYAGAAREQMWHQIAARLAALAAHENSANDAALCRTLSLRLAIARRDHAAFLEEWSHTAPVMPDWAPQFTALATRLANPSFPDRTAPKIFGIGLSKTGTTTLAEALSILGYHTAHFRNPFSNAIIGTPDFDLFDALNDEPVSAVFETLYATYPNAVFIHTLRPLQSWEDSVRRHRIRARGTDAARDIDAIIAAEGPDCALIERLPMHNALWRHATPAAAMNAWLQRVDSFFADKPSRLLAFDVFAGHGWRELCGFLQRPVPVVAFPHANSGRGLGRK